MNHYDLVILDFDGTLADSAPWFRGIVNKLAERFSFRTIDDEEYERLRGEDSLVVLKTLGVPMWKIPRIAKHLHKLVAKESDQIPLFEGVDALLERLSAGGVALAMVSSNREDNVRRILGPENAARFAYFSCGAGAFGKAAKFRDVLKSLKANPARVLAVGDEERDVKAAREAGVAAGAVAWGYATPDILKERNPDHFFETMDDIVTVVFPAAEAVS